MSEYILIVSYYVYRVCKIHYAVYGTQCYIIEVVNKVAINFMFFHLFFNDIPCFRILVFMAAWHYYAQVLIYIILRVFVTERHATTQTN